MNKSEIINIIKSLKNTKSFGYESMSTNIIKVSAQLIATKRNVITIDQLLLFLSNQTFLKKSYNILLDLAKSQKA